jgi:hypothetical protein
MNLDTFLKILSVAAPLCALYAFFLKARWDRKDLLRTLVLDESQDVRVRQAAFWEYNLKGYNHIMMYAESHPAVADEWNKYNPSLIEKILARLVLYPRPKKRHFK